MSFVVVVTRSDQRRQISELGISITPEAIVSSDMSLKDRECGLH
jgi:hypothetical protein